MLCQRGLLVVYRSKCGRRCICQLPCRSRIFHREVTCERHVWQRPSLVGVLRMDCIDCWVRKPMSRSAHSIIDDFARSSMNCPPSSARITTTAAMEARISGVCVRSLGYTTNSCGMMCLGKDGPSLIARRARRALAMLELSLSSGGGKGRVSSSCSHIQSRMHMRGLMATRREYQCIVVGLSLTTIGAIVRHSGPLWFC